jgi:tetratricopeptide (TPR) repeat protein
MAMKLSAIPRAFDLPRPNWEVIQGWVQTNVAESNRSTIWREIAEDWLSVLNESLGNTYRVIRTERILFLAPGQDQNAAALLEDAESGLASITEALGGLACEEWVGPLVILLFADIESYSQYVSPADPEIEFVRSAGVCVKHGYVHIAVGPAPLESLQRTLLHELTHACLSHLMLPLWLEEGITQLAEESAIAHWGRFSLTNEDATELRRYWKAHGLGDFWWGRSFFFYDEGQRHSYRLAQILFRLIMSDFPRRLPDFVRNAHADDAGESAAQEFLGRGLAQIAAQFLGHGRWDPTPPDAPTFCRRGVLHLIRGEYERASNDFTRAIQADSQLSEAYTNRGLTNYQLDRYGEAIADYNEAIRLNPADYSAHNNLAWLRAACPEDSHRDGTEALAHANKACELSSFGLWFCLGTLAAAHAECGDFEEAKRWARESLHLAPKEEREGCQERLRLYNCGKPYREVLKPPVKSAAT